MPDTVMTGESIAALIVMSIVIFVLLLAGAFFFWGYRATRNEKMDYAVVTSTGYLWIAICCWIAMVGAGVGLWWGMYPWKAEYHQWRPISGTVATVDSRLVPAGERSMEDKFVVTFVGNPQQYGVLDTRAATLRPGDDLVITCVKRWQWSGTHGYDCNFVSMTKR